MINNNMIVRASYYEDRTFHNKIVHSKSVGRYIVFDDANTPIKCCQYLLSADIMNLIHNKPLTEDEKIHQDIEIRY